MARRWLPALLALLVVGAIVALPSTSRANGGHSITSPFTVSNVGLSTSLVLDGSGYPVVSFSDSTNGNLNLLHCDDPNCSGTGDSVQAPDTTEFVGSSTSLALDGDGNPVVSYYDATNANLKLLHCNDPNCAGGDDSRTSPDTVGAVGSGTSLTLDANGNPVVSYYDSTNQDLKLMHCNDANCAGGNESIQSPDTAGDVGTSSSLQIDINGDPVVSYYDASNGDLKVLHCNDANCAGGNDSIAPVDTSGSVGSFTSLELETRLIDMGTFFFFVSIPVISYHDGTNANLDLKVVTCNDPNCFGLDENIQSPDTDGFVGQHTSLARDASGYPVVSYFDGDLNGDLKVVHCNDANCSGGNDSVQAPDTDDYVGLFTSLVLDAAGNPVISYYDLTNGDLKVLHCADPNCTSDHDADGTHDGNDPDDDSDGCEDAQEAGPSAVAGGLRSSKNIWDFFDTPAAGNVRDAAITAGDLARVVGRFGSSGNKAIDPLSAPPPAPGYHTAFDRTSLGETPNGEPQGPNGSVTAQDVALIVGQFGHSCA
jgi:hypothetical protein